MNDREQAFTILNRVERENFFAAPLLADAPGAARP